jgi:hypothetical protein
MTGWANCDSVSKGEEIFFERFWKLRLLVGELHFPGRFLRYIIEVHPETWNLRLLIVDWVNLKSPVSSVLWVVLLSFTTRLKSLLNCDKVNSQRRLPNTLGRMFHELLSRDRGEVCAAGQPQRGWTRGVLEQYIAGSDTRGRPEGRSYPRSQQAIHETSVLKEV